MKNNKRINLAAHCLIYTLLFILSSCSQESKMSKLLEHIPDESDVVLVGDVKTMLESAGGSITDSKVKLPDFVLDNMSSRDLDSFDDFNFFLRKSGIDVGTCAIIADYQHSYPIYLFSLDDEKAFIKAITDNGYKEKDSEGEITFYSKKVYESSSGDYDDFAHLAINGKYAYWIEKVWVGSSFKPQKELERIITEAYTAPKSDLKCTDYINEGNALGIMLDIPSELRKELKNIGVPYSVLDAFDGTICAKVNLTDNAISLKAKWFGEDGKERAISDFGSMLNPNATVSSEALSYLGNDESLIFASSMKDVDWDEYFESIEKMNKFSRSEKTDVAVVKSYLEKINGTIAFGIGLKDGLESIFNLVLEHKVMDQFSFTAIIETKDGKSKGLIKDMSVLLEEQNIQFDRKDNGISINLSIDNLSGIVNIETYDNLIIISNNSISQNNRNKVLNSVDYSEHIGGIAFALEKNNKLMRDLDINYDIIANMMVKSKPYEIELCIEVDDTEDEKGIIGRISNTIIDIIENEDEWESRWREHKVWYSSEKNKEVTAIDSIAID